MLPINVDLSSVRVVLAGCGERARRRLGLLDEAGASALEVYAPEPSPQLAAAAGARLVRRWPRPAEIARAQLVFLAGVPEPRCGEIRRIAKAAGILTNVEDDPSQSDFHSAAVVRRGDLSIAISTGGCSPGLAALLREALDRQIGPEWEPRLAEIAALRQAWRAAGVDPAAVGRLTREWAAHNGWFEPVGAGSSHSRVLPLG